MHRTAAGALVLLGLSAGTGAQVPLETAPATYVTLPVERVFDGVVEAVKRSTVSAETSGRIVEINFDVDDYVEKGAVIVRFRDEEPRARLEAAEAGLREARARLAQAEQEHARVKRLHERKLVSKSAMDAATAELRSARARVEVAQARVQEAREQLENTVVRAPYSGIVVERHVEVGEAANVGTPLMTGLSLEQLRAVVRLPQGLVQNVRANGEAHILLPERGQRAASRQLTVFPYADAVTHTFTVRVELPAKVDGLYPGMLVKVAFTVDTARRLMVPARAVVHRSEVTALYVVSPDGAIALRLVRVGRHRNGQVEILAGLEEGEVVALDPIRAGVALKRQRSEAHGTR